MQELRALVDGYAVAADERDGDAFASLFAPEATLVVVGADGAQRSRYEGRAAIAAVPAKLAAYDRTLHLVSTHRCAVDRDRRSATGVAYCEAHHVAEGGDTILYIRYDDTYACDGDDGGWRFSSRTVRTLWEERR